MPQFTLGDLDGRVLDRLEGNSTFYVLAERTNAINEALRVLNLFTGFSQTTVNVSGGTQAGRVFYDVPVGILFPLAIAFNGRQLNRSSLPAMAMRYREWTRHTSSSFGPVADWVPIGIRKFAIHPATTVPALTLAVTGVAEPAALVSTTDTVLVPDEFVETLEELAGHTLQLKEGGQVFSDASLLYQKFLHKMKELTRWRTLQQPRYFVEVMAAKVG